MGTRSTIAIKNQDGSVTGIYCHWDGYVDHVGVMLKEHYNTEMNQSTKVHQWIRTRN